MHFQVMKKRTIGEKAPAKWRAFSRGKIASNNVIDAHQRQFVRSTSYDDWETIPVAVDKCLQKFRTLAEPSDHSYIQHF